MICNESCGEKPEDEKWTKIIEGMTIYTDEQLKGFLGIVGFTNVKIEKNDKGWICVVAEK